MLSPVSGLSFDRDEFSIQVLHAFVELHEFTDLNLVQALRWVLSAGHRGAGPCPSYVLFDPSLSLGLL